MNEFLQGHTWMGDVTFWFALKALVILAAIVGSSAMLLWCIAVIIGSRWEAYQARGARRRRRREYLVGAAITPEITRAWLAAMRESK
jgi:hypothetical protein